MRVFLLLCVLGYGQAPVFKVDANLQSVAVQVTDKRGHGVKGLTASDFTLTEDGHPHKIAFFGSEEEPLRMTILLDASDSMKASRKLERARALVEEWIRGARSQDEVTLVPFTDPSAGEGTAIYDAVATSLCSMRASKTLNQAVVVITDGADQHSRLEIEQLIHLAQISKPEIFMIGFWSKDEADYYRRSGPKLTLVSGHAIDNPQQVFAHISKESGAESFFPSSDRDLEQVLERVRAIVQTQYTIAYYPDSVQKQRKIQVRVHRSGVTVAAPRAVSAAGADDGSIHFDASCKVSAAEHPYPWEPLVTRTPSGILYRDDFSNAQTGWPNRGGSRYAAGGYEMFHMTTLQTRERAPGGVEGSIAAYGPVWKDFAATISVDDLGGASGLVFRLSSRGCYVLLITRAGKPHFAYKLIKMTWAPASLAGSAHKETEILPWTKFGELTGRSPSKRTTVSLKVEGKGERFTIWLDDVQVSQINDASFPDGYVGMAQYGLGRAMFHDLEVRSLP